MIRKAFAAAALAAILTLAAALPVAAQQQTCCATLKLGGALSSAGPLTTTGGAAGVTLAFPTGGPFTFTYPSISDTLAGLGSAQTFTANQSFNSGTLLLKGSSSGTLTVQPAAAAGANTLTLPAGTTNFSVTGGANQVVQQTSAGGAFTVGQLAAASLSDYTAATAWTPVLAGSTTAGTPTYTTQVGWYGKSGNLIFAHFNIVTSAWGGTPAGSVTITGLPVTASATAGHLGSCHIHQWSGITLSASYTYVGANIQPSGTLLTFTEEGSAQAAINMPVSVGTAVTLQGFCSYHS